MDGCLVKKPPTPWLYKNPSIQKAIHIKFTLNLRTHNLYYKNLTVFYNRKLFYPSSQSCIYQAQNKKRGGFLAIFLEHRQDFFSTIISKRHGFWGWLFGYHFENTDTLVIFACHSVMQSSLYLLHFLKALIVFPL